MEDRTFLDDVRSATEMLEAIAANRELLRDVPTDERERLHRAIAEAYLPDPVARRRRVQAAARERTAARAERADAVLRETGIRTLRRKIEFTTPNVFAPENFEQAEQESPGEVDPQHCYICKQKFTVVHHFYDQMCPQCAEFNFNKRTELADLRGRVALLTGGRVKIGYQAGLKLLRAGADLIVTTRFPRDSAQRYGKEPDFNEWGHRLQIFGLDLRSPSSVEALCRHLIDSQPRLDFIINNACQTVRRPPEFYAHMMDGERAAFDVMPPEARRLLGVCNAPAGNLVPQSTWTTLSAELSQVPLLAEDVAAQKHLFPEGRLDQDLQQVDLRGRNSWRLLLAEISSVEMLEVQLINAVAPFIINARLKPLMMRTAER
ncbi:MAG: SDR family NAD(P)-dependent oxidoreductase, partial [Acidobacteriota bacterium]